MSTSYCLRCGEVCDFPLRHCQSCMDKDDERSPPPCMPRLAGTFVRKEIDDDSPEEYRRKLDQCMNYGKRVKRSRLLSVLRARP